MSITVEYGHYPAQNVASTSAVTLDKPVPMTAPNKTLVDELMNARRDRYRQVRLNHGSEGCQVFPVQANKAAEGSTTSRHPSTAPAQMGLLEGVQPIEADEEGNKKLQGQSTAHLLLRVLALSYVVPLCDASEEGLPDNLTRQGYSAQDAVTFMQGLLKEQAGVVEHTFKSRPDNRQDSAISPFESTTLPLWLVPRLLTAAAVLQVRCSYSSAGEKESRLSSSLVKTAQDLICLSLQAPSQGPNIRLLLLESLEASLRAIAYSGRPSFLPSSAPPISLLPKKGEYPNLVSYFPASKAKDYQPPQKRFGDGINRLWMKEDHTMFEPDVKISSPADQSTFARALLLLSCHLCSQVATIYQAELTDIGNTAISLLLSNWKWDTLQHPLVLPYRAQPDHLNDERVKIATSILSGVISRAISSPPYEQLSILIVKRVAAFFTREISPREVTIRSLKNAVPLLRKDVTSTSEEAVTIMQSCTMSLIDELRGSPTSTNQTKTLALEALLFLLTRSKNPRVLLQEKERQAILAVFKLEVIEGGDQDLQWINDEQRKVVTEVLRLLEEHYEQKEAIGDSVDNDLVTPAQCLAIQGFVDGERAPDVMVALRKGKQGIVDYGHLFCASAGSLRREKGVLVCRQCDTHGAEITLEAHFCDFAGLPTVHQLFKVAKAAFDDTNGKAADRENVLHLLCRSISHAKPEQVMREVIRQDVCTLVLRSLIDKSRKVRILAGKLTAAFVNRYTFSGALVLATIGAKVEIIFQIYRDTLQRGRPKAKEAALLGLARLGYNQQSDIRAQTLLLLILQLGSDSLQKSLAYTIITQLANHDRVTVYQLVAPFLDIISAEVIDRIHSAPTLFLEMLQLTNQNQSKFLQSTLQYTLPRVLEKRDDKTLSLIARGIGQDIQTMCFNSTPAILKYFLMQPPHKRDEGIRMFIETVRGSGANDINQRSLLKSYFVELLGHLVIRLGDPEQKKAALAGLHHIRSILNDRQGNVKSTTAKEMALSAFLKDEILAILSWINDDLMNAHGKTTIVHKYMVAESIGALVEVVGQTISVVTPQLMATMNTTMQVKELMLPTLHSWHAFITRLGYSVVGPFIGQTAAALLSSWPRFGPNEKKVASRILSYIVMDSMQELKLFLLQDFPNLEELRGDIPAICDKLASIGSSSAKRPEQRLQHILDRAANENSSICGQALAELKTFLNREKDYVQRITTGNTFDPVVGKIVHILFATVARDDESESLRDSCLENLGILGAIDPDRFKHDKADQTNDLLQDFNDKDEISDFAMHLVRDVLVSAFKATNDTKHQATLAYAIQELLKLAGFSTALLAVNGNYTTNVKVVSLRVKQRFSKFPPEMLDIIAPLLESKYSVHLGDMSVREMPIYRNSSSYKDWVQHWTNHLIVTVTGDHAKSLFGIFRSVIRDHDLGIAQYILPHLVLNILIMGTKEQSWEIRQELVAVLEDQVTPSTDFEPERRLLSAQVVFGLLDHVNVWMRRRTQHRSKQSRRHQAEIDSAVSRVQSTMRTISQELMAIASLKCRAYARSLLNFEQEIRVLRKNGKEDSDLQEHYENMHLIYANLDEPDGMEGISTRIVSSSLEHQIREHESTGRWTSAQSCWEVKIQEKPDDLTLHLGLLRCLRNLGHYDTMRTHIRGVLAVNPEWEKMVDSFYVEGCCILSDWAEVKKRLNKEGAGPSSPSHATARVLLAMHEGDQACLQKSIKDARSLLGKPLIAAGKNSYVSVYESVTQLHMLHELGMISEALGVSRSTASSQKTLCNLSKALEARLASTLPSFRTREPLLSVRRSAFSTRKQDDFRAEIGQSWIFSSKIARRTGHTQTAYSAAMQASQWKAPFAFIQKAKLLAMGDQSQAALQELKIALNSEDFANAADKTASYKESLAHAMLFSARLNDQTGRSRPNDLIQQYRTCAKVDPASEKMWYYLGHYYDQCSERDVANNIQIVNIFTQHLNTCKYLLKSASCGTKFFYRSLPRVLTIWFDCGDDQSILAAQRPKSTTKQQPLAGDVENKVASFRMMNDLVRKFVDKLAPYQWLAVFPQLVSRIVHKNDLVWKALIEIICHVANEYPHQALWTMIAGSQSKDAERKKRFGDITNRLKTSAKSNPGVSKIVDQTLRMAKELLYLCDFPVQKETQLSLPTHFPRLTSLANGELILPLQSSISVKMPGDYRTDTDHRAFEKDLPRIVGFDPKVDVMNSLQKPRKLVIIASDGNQYPFLCKPKDDLRKDARLMEFDAMINNLLQSNSESRKRNLYIRTYSVITLNEECGLIEWVPNTTGLRHILHKLYHAKDIALYTSEVQKNLDKARANPRNAAELFETLVLSEYPSVFHEWFIETFPEPSAWLRARLAYAHTLAVMSMVGHVLGLGDRHGENILFDSESGDVVHVDLNCLFDKATLFEIPERVPFRLTHNLVDALGVTGCEGVFRRVAEITMGILRDNKDSLMSVLEAMVHDPLVEWCVDDRHKASKHSTSTTSAGHHSRMMEARMAEARNSLDPVMQKLNGKLRRNNAEAGGPMSRSLGWTSAYSTNTLVDALIRDATSNQLLGQMYAGWASYL